MLTFLRSVSALPPRSRISRPKTRDLTSCISVNTCQMSIGPARSRDSYSAHVKRAQAHSDHGTFQHRSNECRPIAITWLFFNTSQMTTGPSRSRDSFSTQIQRPHAYRDHVTLSKTCFGKTVRYSIPTPISGMPIKSLKIRKSPWMAASQQKCKRVY